MRISPSQLNVFFNAYVGVSNFSATGSSGVVTTPITTALSTAGRSSVSVPLQVASTTQVGVITTSPNNRIVIVGNSSKITLEDTNGNEIYGRLVESGGVYTLNFYTLQSGVETAYSFGSSTAIDFLFQYQFDFYRLPVDFATNTPARNVAQDARGGGTGETTYTEKLTVTALNTVSSLAKTPNFNYNVVLFVNGIAQTTLGGASADFTVSTKAITWSSANAGFDLKTTDTVIAQYTTLE